MKTAQEIYGIRAIMEAIVQEKTIDKVWLLKGQEGKLFKHLEQIIHAVFGYLKMMFQKHSKNN